jgi:hypothetical protein
MPPWALENHRRLGTNCLQFLASRTLFNSSSRIFPFLKTEGKRQSATPFGVTPFEKQQITARILYQQYHGQSAIEEAR